MAINRTERQKECLNKWLNAKGVASLVLPTGFGKTRVAGMAIQRFVKQIPDAKILVVVPTDVLKTQWIENLIKWDLFFNCQVEIINSVIKKDWEVDFLIQDECHRYAAEGFKKVFERVSYDFLLCLTGTLDRLDGKEEIIKKYAPVADEISIEEAVANGWLSPYKDYKVVLDVDLTEYKEINRKFNLYFAYFNYDFDLAMKLMANKNGIRFKYAKKMGLNSKEVTTMVFDWMRCMRERKNFVTSHPKKLEIAHKILEARKDKKCITFSATVKDAEKIKYGKVFSSKETKKKNQITYEDFNKQPTGVINTARKLDEGADLKGLSVGIILSGDSSNIKKVQRTGRLIRAEEGKTAEMFTLVIRGTQEEAWYNNATKTPYITINEEQLEQVLKYEQIETRQRNNIQNIEFRF